MLAADGLGCLRLMKLFPWASATHIHILAYCDERCFDFGPWLLSVMAMETVMARTLELLGLSPSRSLSEAAGLVSQSKPVWNCWN